MITSYSTGAGSSAPGSDVTRSDRSSTATSVTGPSAIPSDRSVSAVFPSVVEPSASSCTAPLTVDSVRLSVGTSFSTLTDTRPANPCVTTSPSASVTLACSHEPRSTVS